MPYPRGINEFAITEPAKRILQTGDYHPGRFRYPSLPTYIATAAMAVGFIRTAGDEKIRAVEEIGSVYYPYYSKPTVVETARQAFALVSVLAIVAAGVAAYSITSRPSALVWAAVAMSLPPYYFEMSWRYLNVDIIGAGLVAVGMAATLRGIARPDKSPMAWIVVVPAVCTGLAAASKYTYGALLISVVLSILFFVAPARRAKAVATAIALVAISFVAAFPYALLDLPGFLNGLAFEVRHYASGHAGQDGETGLAKLDYYSDVLVRDFGFVGLAAATLGIAWMGRLDWRKLLVFVSFPAILIVVLSTQRVEFARNVLPLFFVVAVGVGVGICMLANWIAAMVERHRHEFGSAARLALAPMMLVFALHVPLASAPDQWTAVPESRREAIAWIIRNVPKDRTIIVPVELELQGAALVKKGYALVRKPFKKLDTPAAYRRAIDEVGGPAVFMVPRWRADRRFPGRELAKSLNEASSAATREMKSFPGRRLMVNYPRTVTEGNPAIAVAGLAQPPP